MLFNPRCVASYMARMGQCFSTSIDTVGFEISQGTIHEVEDDIKTADQKYCFSDGVGRISRVLVTEVWVIDITGTFGNHDGRRQQRKPHKTDIGLISTTKALHVRYTLWYIFCCKIKTTLLYIPTLTRESHACEPKTLISRQIAPADQFLTPVDSQNLNE